MKTENLEGKTMEFANSRTGIVAGYDRDIGITIVNKENSNNYFLCLIGPSSPGWKDCLTLANEEADKVEYYQLFDLVTEHIKSGRFDSLRFCEALHGDPGSNPSLKTCPFAQ